MQSRLRHQYREQRQHCQRAGKPADVHLPGHMWPALILTREIRTNECRASHGCDQRVDECNGDVSRTLASYLFGAKTGNAPSSFVSCSGVAYASNAGVTKILRTHLFSLELGPALPALQGAETAVQ